MTLGTHVAVSALGYLTIASATGLPVAPAPVAVCGAASVLPDIDLPSSIIGRTLWPLARAINRRFGHRTLTHSLLGIALVAALALPLVLVGYGAYFYAILIGYTSHILIDCANPSGVYLFWPGRRVIARLFRNDRYHATVGSAGEYIVVACLVAALGLSYPLAREGFKRSMHRAFADITSAVMDYRDYGERYDTYLVVRRGTDALTGVPVEGRFLVVGALTINSLLVEDGERLRIVGEGQGVHVVPTRCFLERGEPHQVKVTEIDMTARTLRELESLMRSRHAYAFGTLVLVRQVRMEEEPHQYQPVRQAGHEYQLEYARWSDLAEIADIPVTQGRLMVKEVVGTVKRSEVPGARAPVTRRGVIREMHLELRRLSELLVRVGDEVEVGQVLARREDKERELRELEADVKSRRAVLQHRLRTVEAEKRAAEAGTPEQGEEDSVDGARLKWEQAVRDLERVRSLSADGIISGQELERAETEKAFRRSRYEQLVKLQEKRLRVIESQRTGIQLELDQLESEYRRKREMLESQIEVHSPLAGRVIAIEPMRYEARPGLRVMLVLQTGKRTGDGEGLADGGLGSGVGGLPQGRVVTVTDGDTVVVEVGGRPERIRLIGIDAPEVAHGGRPGQEPWGSEARAFLASLIEGREVRIETDVQSRDRYGRLLAYLWVDGQLVNEELVKAGQAVLYTVPPNVKYVERFQKAQAVAREFGRGVWNRSNPLPESPRSWRRRARQ